MRQTSFTTMFFISWKDFIHLLSSTRWAWVPNWIATLKIFGNLWITFNIVSNYKFVNNWVKNCRTYMTLSQPHFGLNVRMKLTLPKSGNLESSGTLKNSKLDCKGQNTSHWSVLSIIGKVLKCRCPKWPCMSHLDICSPSYGQKKGRESN
jgi:hypothetical protein